MEANNKLVLLNKVQSVSKLIPAADLFSTIKLLVDSHHENKLVERDIAAIEAKTQLLIKEMTLRYDLFHKVFDQLFSERKLAIDKSFEIIDKGLKGNDRDLISIGLGNLSQIVSSSPFSNLSELSKLLNSSNTVEI